MIYEAVDWTHQPFDGRTQVTDLNNKTAIITGASRGIGEAAARFFADRGANVVLAARTSNAIERIATEITASGGKAIAVATDVSDFAAVSTLVERTTAEFGGLDILINNAGVIEPIARLADSDPKAWGQIVDINYKGVYHGLRAAIPVMVGFGGGTIINISSGAATGALEGWSHYCSTKAAVLSLTRCADKEYRDQGIRCCRPEPGNGRH